MKMTTALSNHTTFEIVRQNLAVKPRLLSEMKEKPKFQLRSTEIVVKLAKSGLRELWRGFYFNDQSAVDQHVYSMESKLLTFI